MIDWWFALPFEKQLYLGTAVVATALLAGLRFAGAGEPRVAAAMPEIDRGTARARGLVGFIVRVIATFFAGLGWVGSLFLLYGGSSITAAAFGSVGGIILMLGLLGLARIAARTQSATTQAITRAVGGLATVHAAVPAHRRRGGSVSVRVDGRLLIVEARQTGAVPLEMGASVRVVAVINPLEVLVEPA